jgi:hypothetical protein
MHSAMRRLLSNLVVISCHGLCVAVHAQPYGQMGDMEQFLVIVKDASSGNLVLNSNLTVTRADLKSNEYHLSLACDPPNDGIFRLHLSRGKFRFLFSAKGYHPLMVDECVIQTCKSVEGGGFSTGGDALRFFDKTIIYTVKLEPRNGQPAKWRTQPFLSDSVYYHEPEIPPEPIGGLETLKRKVAMSLPAGSPRSGGASWVSAVTSIEKDGRVSDVDMSGDVPQRVQKEIATAIRSTRFNPAKILGIPVRSKVHIPFELSLVW